MVMSQRHYSKDGNLEGRENCLKVVETINIQSNNGTIKLAGTTYMT